jgi:transcriptional regulator with XRE-family HTH domain
MGAMVWEIPYASSGNATNAVEGKVPVNHEKIRELRESLGLTQEQAAKLAGMKGKAQWSELERGRYKSMTVTTLERVAAALGVKARDLLK